MVNDDVQLAIDIGADGIHVGQTDMAVADVAALCHSHCFIGTSVNTLEQGIAAQANPLIDYFGTGPIFPTQSKEILNRWSVWILCQLFGHTALTNQSWRLAV